MKKEKIVENTKNNIEEIIKEDENLNGTEVDFILINRDNKETISIVSDGKEKIAKFVSSSKKLDDYTNIPDWEYNFDEYLFQELENNYEIGYMSTKNHYDVWYTLNQFYPEDINFKKGVQWYLQYCADNGITKKYLDKELKLNAPDIMKYFKGLALHETMNYKGYVIEADDICYDNPKEININIYKSKNDYAENKVNGRISFYAVDLKQAVKEYIDRVYIYTNKEFEEDKKSFCTFVLGYDLLNNLLTKASTLENSISYEFCNMMASEFLKSKEYGGAISIYEMLVKWVEKNYQHIKKSYKDFLFETKVGKTRQLDDGMYIKDIGYRNNRESIALIERTLSDNTKDYIIAFSYEIIGKKINWGYGNYYGYNLKQAEKDFKKVLDGEYLSNVPQKEKKSDEQER